MSVSTSNQIIKKSTLVKAFLENILTDIQENKLLSLRDIDKRDLERALNSCDEIIDLGKFVADSSSNIQNLTA